MNIFVGSLSFKMTEEELQKEFEVFGEVGAVKIILDQVTLKSRGFAFVTMPNQDQATAAIAGLNGKEINGFALKVNEARPREPRTGPPREGGGAGYAANSNRSGYGGGFGSRSGPPSGGGGYGRGRTNDSTNSRDVDIYDTKGGRSGSGGHGKKGRGGGGRGSGGRSGGGKNSY